MEESLASFPLFIFLYQMQRQDIKNPVSLFQDWYLQFPAYPIPEGGLKISKELAQETLNYFRKFIFIQLYFIQNTSSCA